MHITLHCIFSLWRRKEWTHLTLFASLIHYKHKTSTMLHTYYIQCVFVDVVDAIISYFKGKKRHTHQKLNVLYYCSHNDDVCVFYLISMRLLFSSCYNLFQIHIILSLFITSLIVIVVVRSRTEDEVMVVVVT